MRILLFQCRAFIVQNVTNTNVVLIYIIAKQLSRMPKVKIGQDYEKINGCSRQLQCQQVFWVFGLCVLLALYSVFVVPPILQWNNLPMIVCMGILYALLLPVIYDYLVLTCSDPVDPYILTVQSQQSIQIQTKKCSICNVFVKKTSQHCLNCQRCTQELDHHSQLINNCISTKNIRNYIRMNVCFCMSITIMMVESAIIFTTSFYNSDVSSYIINKWTIMLLLIFTFLSFVFSLFNSIYSCYLHCCKKTTRIKHRYRETSTNNSDLSDSEELSDKSEVKNREGSKK